MSKDYENMYLEHKKKIVINIINSFRGKYGYKAFPFELNQDNFNMQELLCNAKLCSTCGGGDCCHTAPCIFSPYDFLDIRDVDYMKNILNTGLICISKSPACGEILVLRPRGREDEKSIVSVTYERNPCILENGSGCMLLAQYRPLQGLLYIPRDDNGTILHSIMYSEYKCAYDYRRFQDVLKALADEYYDKSIPVYEDKMDEQVNKLIKSLIRK